MALRVTAVLFTHSMDRHRIALILKAIAIATTSEMKRHRRPRVRPSSVVRRALTLMIEVRLCCDVESRVVRFAHPSGRLSLYLLCSFVPPSPGVTIIALARPRRDRDRRAATTAPDASRWFVFVRLLLD